MEWMYLIHLTQLETNEKYKIGIGTHRVHLMCITVIPMDSFIKLLALQSTVFPCRAGILGNSPFPKG